MRFTKPWVIEMSELLRYKSGCTLAMSLLVLSTLFPSPSYGQDCKPAKERIFRIVATEAQHVPDSLQVALDLVTFVREECEDEGLELELWLLINEVFVLDKLERYDKADSLVSRFFDIYLDQEETSDGYRARFYMWRMHLRALSGAIIDMALAYGEALKYADFLSKPNRASLYADGAYAYFEGGDYQESLVQAKRAQNLIGTPATYYEYDVIARALLLEAEALLHLDRELPLAREKLGRAIRLYDDLSNPSKIAVATAILGHIHAAEGDTSRAFSVLAGATELAEESGTARSQAYTLWRYGRLLRQAGDFDAAEPVLVRAFEAAQIRPEFYFEAAYELAYLYEQQEEYDRAKHFFRAVVDAPRPQRYSAAMKAQRKVEEAEVRLVLLDSKQHLAEAEKRHRRTLYASGGGFVFLLMLGGVGFLFLRQRYKPTKPPLVVEKARGGVHIIPVNLPTGLGLDQLKQRFQDKMEDPRAGRCWAYAYAALLDPGLVLPFLKAGAQADAPWLADLVKHVEADSVPNNRVLHRCVIAVEAAVDGETYGKNPENTMLKLFQRECDKRDWAYPTHPTEWKRHFIEHHLDILFERS